MCESVYFSNVSKWIFCCILARYTKKVGQRLLEESELSELKPFLFWVTSALTGNNLKEFSKVLGELSTFVRVLV